MHVDVITKYFYPVTAGIETNILETYAVLVQMGWSITIHTTASTLDEKNILPSRETIRGMQVIRYHEHLFGFSPIIDYPTTSMICLHNFNIFPHLTILVIALWHRLIRSRSYGIFLTPHGGFTPEWPMFTPISRLVKYLYHQTVGLFLINHVVDGIRAISKWEQQELTKFGIHPVKINLIENGLDPVAQLNHAKLVTPKIKQLTHQIDKYIIAIGRISPIKNYETIIRAISKIDQAINIVILGPVQDQSYQDSLIKLAQELGIAKQLHFLGVIKGSDKYYIVQKSLAFIHMARWESFCNVVYEAMSLGKTCIVADNTALSSLVDHSVTGIVTPTYDSDKLAENIKLFTNNTKVSLRKFIYNNLRAKKFPIWGETAIKMDIAYNRVQEKYEKYN